MDETPVCDFNQIDVSRLPYLIMFMVHIFSMVYIKYFIYIYEYMSSLCYPYYIIHYMYQLYRYRTEQIENDNAFKSCI